MKMARIGAGLVVTGTVLAFIMTGCQMRSFKKTPCPKTATSRPYAIDGKHYVPQQHYEMDSVGCASYYGGKDGMHGCLTCTGQPFSMFAMTAAHKTLPIPCKIKVTNLDNGRQAVLTVNDRGPFAKNRILDVSANAARVLGFYDKGYAKVRIQTLVPQSQVLARKKQEKNNICIKHTQSPLVWYYVALQCTSAQNACMVQKKVAEYGKSHSVRRGHQWIVLVGPYRSPYSAQEMIRYVPQLRRGTIVKKDGHYPATHLGKRRFS